MPRSPSGATALRLVVVVIGIVITLAALVLRDGGTSGDTQTNDSGRDAATNVTPTSPVLENQGSAAQQEAPTTSSVPPASTSLVPNATVIRIVDGDTIDVDIDGQRASVRLIGIDTPEKTGGFRDAECYGDEATERMQQLLTPGDEVFLERDEEQYDQYDRVLAYVHRGTDALFLNHQLVLEGFAAAKRYEPNTFHAELLEDAQDQARQAQLGLWSACGGPDRPIDG
jgi:endonuclease YncB( thermonuclease family)